MRGTRLAPLLVNLGDKVDFHTGSKGHLSNSEGAAGMLAADSKNFGEQFGCTVRYEMLFSECRRAVDQDHQLDDLPNLIEIADSQIQRRQQVDCDTARSYCSELRGEICAKLSHPGFAVLLRDMARHEDLIGATHEGEEGCDGGCDFGQLDPQRRDSLIYGHETP